MQTLYSFRISIDLNFHGFYKSVLIPYCNYFFFTTMKSTTILIVLIGLLATSYSYVLDSSCDPYRSMVISGMQGAFDLAAAGSDTFGFLTPSGRGAIWQARKDLVSYLFSQALTNGNIDNSNTNWKDVWLKFESVLTYNSNNGQLDASPSNYRSLGSNGLIVYCDYSRFKENQDCQGNRMSGRILVYTRRCSIIIKVVKDQGLPK